MLEGDSCPESQRLSDLDAMAFTSRSDRRRSHLQRASGLGVTGTFLLGNVLMEAGRTLDAEKVYGARPRAPPRQRLISIRAGTECAQQGKMAEADKAKAEFEKAGAQSRREAGTITGSNPALQAGKLKGSRCR